MRRPDSERTLKWLYMAVSVAFMLLTAWLYWKEDSYIKMMGVEVAPKKGRFQVEILAEGKNMRVLCDDPETNLFVEEKLVEGRRRLLIHGECREERGDSPVLIRIIGDSRDMEEKWKYQILMGGEGEEAYLTVRPNGGRVLCLLAGTLAVIAGAISLFGRGSSRKYSQAAVCGNRILRKLERDPGLGEVLSEGERLFAASRKRQMMNVLCLGWLWLFLAFWMVHSLYHGDSLSRRAGVYGTLTAGVFLLAAAARSRGKVLLMKPLTVHCRPLTAAVLYLKLAGSRRDKRGSGVWYHNGAVGLLRGGYYEEALALSREAWKLSERRAGVLQTYMHLSLEQRCLAELGYRREALEAKGRMEAFLEAHPSLKRRPDIRRNLSVDEIRRQVEDGEMEQAESGAQSLLNQCRSGYSRLPVLGVLTAVKEHLGKEAEAELLRNQLLEFCPENIEVRHERKEGRLHFRRDRIVLRDKADMAVRLLCAVGIAVFFFLTAAPGLKTVSESYGAVEEESGVAVEPALETAGAATGAGRSARRFFID